jgi:hypothetical protein
VIAKNEVGHAMIGNKSYHLLPFLVRSTNPSIIMVLYFNDIMHEKVHCVNQTPRPKYIGKLFFNDCSCCLTINNIISDDLNDIVGPNLLNGFNQGICNINAYLVVILVVMGMKGRSHY